MKRKTEAAATVVANKKVFAEGEYNFTRWLNFRRCVILLLIRKYQGD